MNRSLGFYLINTGKSWSLRRSVPTCTWQHWTCDPLKILCSNENSHFPHDQLLCVCRKHKNTGFHFVVLTIDWLNILPQPCTHTNTHTVEYISASHWFLKLCAWINEMLMWFISSSAALVCNTGSLYFLSSRFMLFLLSCHSIQCYDVFFQGIFLKIVRTHISMFNFLQQNVLLMLPGNNISPLKHVFSLPTSFHILN